MRSHRRHHHDDPATDAERQELARTAWATISHLFMTSAGRFEGIAEGLGLGPSDLGALLHMDPDATPSQGELAREWSCDASWVTAKVDSLEDLGLVARVPDPTDRRRKTVTLTAAGRTRQAEALDRLYDPPEQIGSLSLTDLRALARVFAKVDVPDLRENGHFGGGRGGPAMKGPPRRAAGTVARAAKAAQAHQTRTRSRRPPD